MPRTKTFAANAGSAEVNAMIECVAPAILELLADCMPHSKPAIVEALVGRHSRQDVVHALIPNVPANLRYALVFAAAGSVATDPVVAEPVVEALGVPRPAVVLLALVLTFLPIVGGLAPPVIPIASPPTPAVPAVRVGVGSVVVTAVTAVVVVAVLASRERE